ncbi:cadmium-translocating P-type ATPase [Microvirga sp. BT689]|uniref:heavy metal translocating P-type ATPase n=1 Tax=Microvirga arvi TaxID=2778731 RepID=UPI00194DB34E|nr:heavy metal translocating P-type ATPase [Microvirga arvi]MBM6583405.1 cadmium-translocating P-type ATPase [Microvirga arvi]
MTCCAPVGVHAALGDPAQLGTLPDEIRLASRDLGDGSRQTDLSVPGVRCAACIAAVERTLARLPGVERARVNLSTRRVAVAWRTADGTPPDMIGTLRGIGYEAHLFAPEQAGKDPELARLVRALAVAGFCAMNIMMLSLSVWSGADAGSRQAFHLISALLALPALLYSGRVFYASAWSALRHGRTNMDVPISIGVSLAFALSLYDTLHNAPHAYFDAATSLLFFLLIGRTLDHVMRERARSAVAGLARLAPAGATILRDGRPLYVPVSEIEPGSTVLVAAGERVPIDGVVEHGMSELDCSVVSGESAPRKVALDDKVQAGVMNLTGPLTVRATARAEDSFLAEMVRMMAAAEGGRARYRRLADRAAALYSPVVHTMALLSFLGWLYLTGDWHMSVTIAIAVLIITCPCALGLAVPIVQVVAARRLFERGIMVKDGTALERMAEIDGVAFDKTGTLTLGRPSLLNAEQIPPSAMGIAFGMTIGSRHPAARAIAEAAARGTNPIMAFDRIEEVPGLGLEAVRDGDRYRLGRPEWALEGRHPENGFAWSMSYLARNGDLLAAFVMEDSVRPDAREAVDDLVRQGLAVEIVSGDRAAVVEGLASKLGVHEVSSGLLPSEKVTRVASLEHANRKILMVGDGLNDAPALAAAHVSMAPATAADIGRNAADFVFLNESLSAVGAALGIARRSRTLIVQNFALAVGYNALAVPVAVLGYVTPLVAAVAMSLSSIIVVANALRLPSIPNGAAGPGAARRN